MAGLRLYISADSPRSLFASALDSRPLSITEFVTGSQYELEIGLLKRNTDSPVSRNSIPWILQPSSGYSIQMGIYLPADGSQLTYANAFTPLDDFHQVGTLLCDTAAITSAVTAATLACIFQINVKDSTGRPQPAYRNDSWVLRKTAITAASVSVQPSEVAASQSWVAATFLPKDGSQSANPVSSFIMLSRETQIPFLVTISDDGQLSTARFAS